MLKLSNNFIKITILLIGLLQIVGCSSDSLPTNANNNPNNSNTLIEGLSITNPTGEAVTNLPVRSGIPLPKGLLKANESVSLYLAENKLPTQFKTLSVWDDNSIRWLLLDTEVSLAAYEKITVDLKKESSSSIDGNAITINTNSEFITVDTGDLKVEIPKLYGGIINRVWLNNEIVINESTSSINDRGAFIRVFDSASSSSTSYSSSLLTSTSTALNNDIIKQYKDRVNTSNQSAFNLYDPWNLNASIEESGPLHSVIRLSGTHLSDTDLGFSSFIIRLHFYRNKNSIQVSHTMVYTGDETQQIQAYGLRLPSASGTTVVNGVSANTDINELKHTAYDQYSLNNSNNSGQALGYIARTNNNKTTNIILRDMAEHFPKALTTSTNSLEIQLYPLSETPWNLTKYTPPPEESDFDPNTYPILSQIASKKGETTSFTNHLYLRGAQGLSTSNDYLLSFNNGAVDKNILNTAAQLIDAGPIRIVAPKYWVSNARVMGIGPFEFDEQLSTSEGHFRIDKTLKIAQDFMRFNQRIQFSWFGIENYGDIRGRFVGGGSKSGGVWSGKGRYGWSGNSGEPSNQLWVQYLRQPSQQTLLDAEALARHTLDQQTVHFATSDAEPNTELDGRNMFSSVGSLHRHGVQAWSGYAGSPDYSHVAGIETYYYLTGDMRAKEVLYEQAQFITRQTQARTALKNGLEVVDRAAAVFYDQPEISDVFEAKALSFINYLESDPNNSGYNAVESRLIDRNNNGIHDSDDGLTKRQLFAAGFEYFMRGAPGILYRHERKQESNVADLILDAANVLTNGDPLNPTYSGDDWQLGLDGHAGSYFYHINSLSYAAVIAQSKGNQNSDYYQLAKLCVENNTHAGIDTNDTSPISLDTYNNLPEDWTSWMWLWQDDSNGEFMATSPGILWLDRVIMYKNDKLQDYHSYRAFIHLPVAAALVNPTEIIMR